jgi:hypothetical protein
LPRLSGHLQRYLLPKFGLAANSLYLVCLNAVAVDGRGRSRIIRGRAADAVKAREQSRQIAPVSLGKLAFDVPQLCPDSVIGLSRLSLNP